jgi:hypothetical protein
MNAFISYQGLPIKSGGAHTISGKKQEIVFDQLSAFIHKYTNASLPVHREVVIDRPTFAEVIKNAYLLGLPNFDFSNYLANGQKRVSWSVSSAKVRDILNLYRDSERHTLGVTWKFHFIDPDSKIVLPGQDEIPSIDSRLHNSHIYLRLSKNKATISAWFTFPFGNVTKETSEYIEGLERSLPFKFSDKTWRKWTLSKNGNWTPKRIEINVS